MNLDPISEKEWGFVLSTQEEMAGKMKGSFRKRLENEKVNVDSFGHGFVNRVC
jgi:hypothetical protein